MPLSARAKVIEIDGPAGPIPLRIIAPPNPAGVYLHIHGGGWTWGTADEQDPWLDRLADRCGFAGRLGRIPARSRKPLSGGAGRLRGGRLVAAFAEAQQRFGTDRLFIGGESAGAHLALGDPAAPAGPAWSHAVSRRQPVCRVLRRDA